jgi:hypothetical protein
MNGCPILRECQSPCSLKILQHILIRNNSLENKWLLMALCMTKFWDLIDLLNHLSLQVLWQSVYHGPILLFCTYIYLNTVSFIIVLSCCFVSTYTWTQSVYHSPILLFCTYIYLNTVSLSWSYPVVLYLHIPEHSQFIIVLSCCFVSTYTWTQSVYHSPILLFCTYIYLNTVSLSCSYPVVLYLLIPEHFVHCDSKLMQLLHRI